MRMCLGGVWVHGGSEALLSFQVAEIRKIWEGGPIWGAGNGKHEGLLLPLSPQGDSPPEKACRALGSSNRSGAWSAGEGGPGEGSQALVRDPQGIPVLGVMCPPQSPGCPLGSGSPCTLEASPGPWCEWWGHVTVCSTCTFFQSSRAVIRMLSAVRRPVKPKSSAFWELGGGCWYPMSGRRAGDRGLVPHKSQGLPAHQYKTPKPYVPLPQGPISNPLNLPQLLILILFAKSSVYANCLDSVYGQG